METVLDITNDENLGLLKTALDSSPVKPFELLKHSNFNKDYERMPSDMFADQENKQFPIFSPEDAAVSSLYIYKQASEVSEDVKSRVEEALTEFNMQEFIPLLDGEKELQKTADAMRVFIMPSKFKFPATSPELFRRSIDAIQGALERMPLADKVECGTNVMRLAPDLGIDDVPEWARVYGQANCCSIPALESGLFERRVLSEDPTYRQIVIRIKHAGGPNGILGDTGILRHIVKEIIEADRRNGLLEHKELDDPFKLVFNQPPVDAPKRIMIIKKASEEQVTIGSKDFFVDEIESFVDSPNVALVGDELVKEAMVNGVIDTERLIGEIQSMPIEVQEDIANVIEATTVLD